MDEKNMIEDVYNVIVGTTDSPGMVSRLNQIEKNQEETKKANEKVVKFCFGNGDKGVDERLRNLERVQRGVVKFVWIIISAVIVAAVGTYFYLG